MGGTFPGSNAFLICLGDPGGYLALCAWAADCILWKMALTVSHPVRKSTRGKASQLQPATQPPAARASAAANAKRSQRSPVPKDGPKDGAKDGLPAGASPQEPQAKRPPLTAQLGGHSMFSGGARLSLTFSDGKR